MATGEDLQGLTREDLVLRAERLGVAGAANLDRRRLIDEIARRSRTGAPGKRAGGWLGRARDLVARVVEQGLHLPDAANLLRGVATPPPPAPPPLPTVTLAEIYAAQGHTQKAIAVLDEVLAREPEHREARALRARYAGEDDEGRNEAERDEAGEDEGEAESPAGDAPLASPTVAARPTVAEPGEAQPALETLPTEGVADERPAEPADAAKQARRTSDVVCLPTQPTSMFVYWEVRPIDFARARWRDPRGRLVLRLCAVTARPDTAEVSSDERDIPIEGLSGELSVDELTPNAEVRVCVGWLGPRGFTPLAVAAEVTMPRDYRAETEPHILADAGVAESWRRASRHAVGMPGGDSTRSFAVVASAPAPREAVAREPRAVSLPARVTGVTRIRRTTRASESYGGASDLVRSRHDVEEHDIEGYGGASDLFGGASDRYGGASNGPRGDVPR